MNLWITWINNKEVFMDRKCSCCGSANLVLGDVQTADSFKLYFIANKDSKKLFPKSNKIAAFVSPEYPSVLLAIVNLAFP